MILRIPAVPEASYLAEGDVITSTFSIDSAGSCLKPWGPEIPTKPDGLPFIKILTYHFLVMKYFLQDQPIQREYYS